MTAGPDGQNQSDDAGVPAGGGAATVNERLESGVPAIRLLFVLVPLIVVVAGGLWLMGLWSRPVQPLTRPTTAQPQQPRKEKTASERTAIFDQLPNSIATTPDRPPGTSERPAEPPNLDPRAVAALVAKADPDEGAKDFRICAICHTITKDGQNRIGPNLWGLFDRPMGTYPGFAYSVAIKAKRTPWTDESMAAYLNNPRAYMRGTKMAYRGMSDAARIANVIAYMRTLSDRPTPPRN
jgi:cytochrome c